MAIIREELIKQYNKVHEDEKCYGSTSSNYIKETALFIEYLRPRVVLDYGCGKGKLIEGLAALFPDVKFYGYDPSIEGKNVLPVEKADLVLNTDVLEHIPENDIPDVVEQIANISKNVFFVLHHSAAIQILPNGQNAHCTIKPPSWYHSILSNHFKNITYLRGRTYVNTAVITFQLPPPLIDKYNEIIGFNIYPNRQFQRFFKTELLLNDINKMVITHLIRKQIRHNRLCSKFFFCGSRHKRYIENNIKLKSLLKKLCEYSQ